MEKLFSFYWIFALHVSWFFYFIHSSFQSSFRLFTSVKQRREVFQYLFNDWSQKFFNNIINVLFSFFLYSLDGILNLQISLKDICEAINFVWIVSYFHPFWIVNRLLSRFPFMRFLTFLIKREIWWGYCEICSYFSASIIDRSLRELLGIYQFNPYEYFKFLTLSFADSVSFPFLSHALEHSLFICR